MANSDTVGYARALAPIPFTFPRDHGPHTAFKTEWWYFTGNLAAKDGRRFGYQLTFFRSALAPPSARQPRTSAWAANDLYLAHFAVTDVQGNRFFASERLMRGAAGQAGIDSLPIRVFLTDWQLAAQSPNDLFPARLQAAQPDYALQLTLQSGKPLVLQGNQGYSAKSRDIGNASYYYSGTHLPTTGSIRIGSDTFQITGTSWLDREWSTSALGKDQVGWDWFALQLSDNTELMYYQLRHQNGTPDPASAGSLALQDGTSVPVAMQDVQLQVLAYWTHPRSGIRYPAKWRVQVPKLALDVTVTPLIADQELPLAIRYWEGAVQIVGTRQGKSVSGYGYVELTGYGDQAPSH